MTPQEWTAEMLGLLLWTLGQAVVEVQMLCVHEGQDHLLQ